MTIFSEQKPGLFTFGLATKAPRCSEEVRKFNLRTIRFPLADNEPLFLLGVSRRR